MQSCYKKSSFRRRSRGKTLTIEVSALAEQANAAVIAKYGETVVLATAVMGRKDVELDYMPLKVDYEEKFYAAGKIIGSRYVRREGRSSEEAILAGRLVDRTIRPLFDDTHAARHPGGRHGVADRRTERSGVRGLARRFDRALYFRHSVEWSGCRRSRCATGGMAAATFNRSIRIMRQ